MGAADAGYRERPGRHPAVAAVWSSVAGAAGETLVAADGCFDLIVRVSNRRVSTFVYTPVARAHHAAVAAGDRHVGVRLRPGFGAALLNDVDIVTRAQRLVSCAADESGDDLEALVVDAVEGHGRQPAIVADFLAAARRNRGSLRLTAGASAARQRELQRACRRWIGMGPKAFLRIERAWAARDAMVRATPLAAIAADLGYADQAHLTREVRELLGMTPQALRSVAILQDGALPLR